MKKIIFLFNVYITNYIVVFILTHIAKLLIILYLKITWTNTIYDRIKVFFDSIPISLQRVLI